MLLIFLHHLHSPIHPTPPPPHPSLSTCLSILATYKVLALLVFHKYHIPRCFSIEKVQKRIHLTSHNAILSSGLRCVHTPSLPFSFHSLTHSGLRGPPSFLLRVYMKLAHCLFGTNRFITSSSVSSSVRFGEEKCSIIGPFSHH